MLDFIKQRTQSQHKRIRAMLSAYLDGELTAKEQQQLGRHLAQCDACAKELHSLQYTKALLVDAPTLRIPRSFVVRRVDLEARADKAPHRLFGLSPRLAYAYMRGATALVAVAFAVLAASDLIGQFSASGRQPAMVSVREALVAEKEIAVEVTVVVEKAVEEPAAVQETRNVEVEKEVEKAAIPDATPSPAMRQAPPATEETKEGLQVLVVPEAAPVQSEDAEDSMTKEAADPGETYGVGDTPTPAPSPTTTPPSPTPLPPTPASPPTATPAATGPAAVRAPRSDIGFNTLRIAEIGLGALALILLAITLIIRQRQP